MKYIKKFVVVALLLNLGLNAQNIRDFELKDLENVTRSYSELKGENLTLIDFWATWCSPCKKAIPVLNKIYETYKDQGVEIIGINGDGPRSIAKVVPFSRALQIKYPVLIDMNSELKSELNLVSFPSLIIVDSQNKIIWTHEGYISGDAKIIKSIIEKNLNTEED